MHVVHYAPHPIAQSLDVMHDLQALVFCLLEEYGSNRGRDCCVCRLGMKAPYRRSARLAAVRMAKTIRVMAPTRYACMSRKSSRSMPLSYPAEDVDFIRTTNNRSITSTVSGKHDDCNSSSAAGSGGGVYTIWQPCAYPIVDVTSSLPTSPTCAPAHAHRPQRQVDSKKILN